MNDTLQCNTVTSIVYVALFGKDFLVFLGLLAYSGYKNPLYFMSVGFIASFR